MPHSPSTDLTELGVGQLAALIRARTISAEEVARAHLARIDALDETLGSFVFLDPERVLADARTADAAQSSGGAIGPLHGVPIGFKDIFDVGGMPTSGGSRLPPRTPEGDGAPAGALRAAGAVAFGKLTTSEFSCGSPFLQRQPRNPWQRDHVAGGSSTGCGIAVSANLLPAAIGGDTGGSVRIPASFCGIVGLRPSAGAVRVDGFIPLAPGLDAAGPMARSAADAELLLRTMVSGDHEWSVDKPTAITLLDLSANEHVDPMVAAAVERVARGAASVLGVELRITGSGSLGQAWAGAWTAIYTRALTVHVEMLRRHVSELSRPLVWKLCAAAALTDEDRRAGAQVVSRVMWELGGMVDGGALLVLPTMARTANRVDARYEGGDTMSWTAGATVAGLPAITLPAGLGRDGLPIGVQLVGARGSDFGMLRTSSRLEVAEIARHPGTPGDLSGDARGGVPLEEPPEVSVALSEREEIRRASRRLGLPELDDRNTDGAARSLRAVRQVLY